MNYENFKPGFNKPTIITAQQYGTKVSVEIDHSDTDIDELFDAFQTLVVGLGYHESAWKQWIIDRADEYNEEDGVKIYPPEDDYSEFADKVKQAIEDRLPKVNEEEEDEFFGKYDIDETGAYHTNEDWDKERYRATEEDESEFDDYGQRIHPTFEWGDEPEDNWFDEEKYQPNEELIEGKKKYDNALKALTKKQKQNDNKTKKRNTKG